MINPKQLTHIFEAKFTEPKDVTRDFIERLTDKMNADGHPDMIEYSVYLNDAGDRATFIIRYKDADVLVDHHDLISGWEILAEGQQMSRPVSSMFVGPQTPRLKDWIQSKSFPFEIGEFGRVAGFVR